MIYFKIGNNDFSNYVQSLKVNMEVLVADSSGRNASGDLCIDIIGKKDKIEITWRTMNNTEMKNILTAIQDYVINITYLNPQTNSLKTINCYTSTPIPDYYCISDNKVLYKSFNMSFIEL